MFYYCDKPITTITISNPNITSYDTMFNNAATNDGASIKINYITENSNLVNQMIAIKSSNSNVVKSKLIS